jgi:hypothetical protein
MIGRLAGINCTESFWELRQRPWRPSLPRPNLANDLLNAGLGLGLGLLDPEPKETRSIPVRACDEPGYSADTTT